MSSTSAPAVRGAGKKELKDWLASTELKEQVALALPQHIKSDHFMRVILNATIRNPDLFKCTQDSVLKCLLDLAAVGLEADGRHAHLIPYGQVCTLVLDYKGLVKLVLQSGNVSTIHADVVFENDQFDFWYGTGQKLEHRPLRKGERGVVTCAYSYVRMKDGTETFEVMSLEDLNGIRERSRAKNNGPWKTDTNEMYKKTVFRRHSKWLPISAELAEKIARDDEHQFNEADRFARAKPARTPGAGGGAGSSFMAELGAGGNGGGAPTDPEPPGDPGTGGSGDGFAPGDRPATPLEGMSNLLKASQVEELFVLEWAAEKGITMGTKPDLGALSDEQLKKLIAKSADWAADFRGE